MKNLKHLFIALFLLTISMSANPQNIFTIAGNGDPGYSGDGYPATSIYCEFYYPAGISIDAKDDIYVADVNNNIVREINSSGVIMTFAGNHKLGPGFSGDNGPATDAQLNACNAVCVDYLGNVYIADQGNNAIRMVNLSGIISTIAGIGVGGYNGDGKPATSAELYYPSGIYVDATGNIYISDEGNNRIRKINTSGIISTIAGNGIEGYSGDGGLADTTELDHPIGICGDPTGNIYFADATNNRIREINTSGIISTIAGNGKENYTGALGNGGLADTTALWIPYCVLFDNKSGNIYISNTYDNRICEINKSGIISDVAGTGFQPDGGAYSGDGGPATDAELASPWGLAMDIYGNIYFADAGNQRIRAIGSDLIGINDIQANMDISIYPNPTNQKLTINLNSQNIGLVTLSIMDIIGREVLNKQLTIPIAIGNNSQFVVDVSSLTPGVYFLRIKNGNNYVIRKFIKQ